MDDLEREAGQDDDEYGDYEDQVDIILKDMFEKVEKVKNRHAYSSTGYPGTRVPR